VPIDRFDCRAAAGGFDPGRRTATLVRVRLLVPLAVAAALLATAAGASPADRRAASCRTIDHGRQTEAVFGHFATRAAAERFHRIAIIRGFKGFQIEDDGCGDFELESDNISRSQRTEFAAEAQQSRIEVTWEQVAPPDRYVPGFVVAVFGTRRTIQAANALEWKVAGYGFRYVDIAYGGPGKWRVLVPGIPAGKKAAFRAEVRRSKHLQVTFARH
jgi:hypothetical protein